VLRGKGDLLYVVLRFLQPFGLGHVSGNISKYYEFLILVDISDDKKPQSGLPFGERD